METLSDHKLLIDAECPMCQIYGGAFEKYGFLESGSCLPYQKAGIYLNTNVDANRAQNEIALLDSKTNKVVYGIDALGLIISHRYKWFKPILSLKAVSFFLHYFYKFISQNRKVIAPTALNSRTCVPDLIPIYRFTYILLVALLSASVIFNYSQEINNYMNWSSNIYRELAICSGQIFWQLIFNWQSLKDKKWEYLGNMSTISLMGSFALLPFIFFNQNWVQLKIFWFLFVVTAMTIEHLRRCKLLDLSTTPTFTWLSYRILILLIIFNIH